MARGGRGSRPPPRGRDRSNFSTGPQRNDDQHGELNAGLTERFGRGPAFRERNNNQRSTQPDFVANIEVRRYFANRQVGAGAPRWTVRPEIPHPEELLPYPVMPTQPFVEDASAPNGWSDEATNGWGDTGNTANDSWGEPTGATQTAIGQTEGTTWGNEEPTADAWATESKTTDAWSTRPAKGDAWDIDDTWTPQETGDGWADDAWIQSNPAAQEDPWKSQNDEHVTQNGEAEVSSNPVETTEPTEDNKAVPKQHEPTPEVSKTIDDDGWGPEPAADNGWETTGPAPDNDWGTTNEKQWNAAMSVEEPPQNNNDDFESFENVHNIVEGPWPSKIDYLRTHYLLLREEALRPLREAVEHVRSMPDLNEDPTKATIGIYDQVQVCGLSFARKGLGIRVKFSLGRVGKNIRWAQSKRLITGTLVILMSPDKTKCKIATVAARPLELLNKNPPEIDLFFGRSEDLDIDSSQDWIMIEERGGFFEAQRHTLVALQRMVNEKFPMQEHLIHVETSVPPPAYLEKNSIRDLRPIAGSDQNHQALRDVDLLQEWPSDIHPDLDESQMHALNIILTKRLGVVQGPPGTGKTYVSIEALKVMLKNKAPSDPPIIITCQTNHALDQLLEHVSKFEEKYVRIGSRSGNEEIKKRTLYELKSDRQPPPFKGRRDYHRLESEVGKLIAPLMKAPLSEAGKDTISLDLIRELGVLSNEQCDSVITGANEWESVEQDADDRPLLKWIGKQLEPVKQRHQPVLLGYEEIDEGNMGFEEVMEQEAEQVIRDEDDEMEGLGGTFFPIGDTWTGRAIDNKQNRDHAKELLKKTDLWKIRATDRGNVYRHIQREAKIKITERLRQLFPQIEKANQDRKIHRWEFEETILKENKVIGLTTTGVSKYRGLINALKPKIVLIEEAAETLEAPVIAACMESVEHLVLVGDHKQLRPNTHVQALQKPPYNMNISLFERLVNNDVDYRILQRQRRMRPEIRRILNPIYGDKIKDHASVSDLEHRPLVPGMGGLTSFLYSHEYPDDRDQEFSSFNIHEAEMILGLVQYLHYNGMAAKDITILTFYNGQRRQIKKLFAADDKAKGQADLKDVRLATVDSYQGEENGVVILSLVRSNTNNSLGFIGVDNRICVALSRAQRGFYIFGNAELLASNSWLWSQVIMILYEGDYGRSKSESRPKGREINSALFRGATKRRIGFALPLWCKKHERRFWIRSPLDWERNVGGCDRRCGGHLACGHACPHLCHPWDHSLYSCREPCPKMMPCGHRCSRECYQSPCECKKGCPLDGSTVPVPAGASAASPSGMEPQEAPLMFRRPSAPLAPARADQTVESSRAYAIDGASDTTPKDTQQPFKDFLSRSEPSERVLKQQAAEQRKKLDEENHRLLFMDDASSDGTSTKLLRSEQVEDGRVRRTWEMTYISPHQGKPQPSLMDQ